MIGPKREKLTPRQEAEAYELATLRDGERCMMPTNLWGPCGGAVQRDHRQNRDPFNTVVENLQCLCVLHHKWKTEHPTAANVQGWGCPAYEEPKAWPARRVVDHRLEWVRYLTVDEWAGVEDDAGYLVISDVEAAAMRAGLVAEEVPDAP